MNIRKRDGRIVEYDRTKIEQAVKKAFMATLNDMVGSVEVIDEVSQVLHTMNGMIFDVETIQDVVETILMRTYPEVAKRYILYRRRRSEIREATPDPNAISDYIHVAKYARYLPDLERRETYQETVARVELMHKQKFPNIAENITSAFDLVRNKEILPSMRSMQFAGEAIEDKNARMFNCSFSLVDRPRVFAETLYLLLCGCGCGFSVQKHHIKKLPKLSKINYHLVCHHKIEDNIIGWADAVDALMQGFIDGYYVEFDFSAIRPAGSYLHKSGGRAPGHLALSHSLHEMRCILTGAQGRHLKPIECYDIICHLSSAVLAGGIRRSSLIALFSQDDEEMLHSKDGIFLLHRALCNNSVVFTENTTKSEFLDIMNLNRTNYGDPGFVWLPGPNYGINPCGEIVIDPTYEEKTGWGFCNLVEVNTAGCKNVRYAVKNAAFIATLQASYTDFSYLDWPSQASAERDALIGVSLTGIYDSNIDFTPKLLRELSYLVKNVNIDTANMIGINSAVRCTCIKPSGTASLELGGISSGIHPNHAKRYFRRITANPIEPIAQYFRLKNPHMVTVKPDGDWCLTFPMAGNYEPQTAMEFLNKIKLFYDNWIIPGSTKFHHNISCTITVDKDEWDDVFDFIFEHKPSGMTFIPAQSDKDIPFCPREAVITETDIVEYLKLIHNYKTIDYTSLVEKFDMTVIASACDGDSCDIPINIGGGNGEQVFQGCRTDESQFEYQGKIYKVIEQHNGWYIGRLIR